MNPYTIRTGTKDGRATAALWEDDKWSFSVVHAPDDDPTNAEAALGVLAEQLAHNIKHDRMTQIMLDPSRIPEPLASKVRDLLETP